MAQSFRDHLAAEATADRLGLKVAGTGTRWREDPDWTIDAVMLGGRGDARWWPTLGARPPLADLMDKAAWLVDDPMTLRYVVCAREQITNAPHDILSVTADDMFPTTRAT